MTIVLYAIPQLWIVPRQVPQHLLAQLILLHGPVQFFAGGTFAIHVVGQRQRHLIHPIELVDIGRHVIEATFPVHLQEEEGASEPGIVPMRRPRKYKVTIVYQLFESGSELLPSDAKHLEQLRRGLEGSLRRRSQRIGALGVAQPVDVLGQHLLLALRAVAVPLPVDPKEQRGDGVDRISDGRNHEALAPLRQVIDVAVIGQRLAHGQMSDATTIGIDQVLEGLGVVGVMSKFESHVIATAGGFELQMLHGILAVVVLAIEGFDHGGQESSRAWSVEVSESRPAQIENRSG